MKNVTCKKKMCSTCPWREENKHQLIHEQLELMKQTKAISPCHQELEKVTGSCTSGVEIYAREIDTFVVCNGIAKMQGLL